MTKDQAIAVVALGKRGFSVEAIKRSIAKDYGKRLDAPSIHRVLGEAGLDDGRDPQDFAHDCAIFEEPNKLRRRWEQKLPAMKAKLRASMGRL